MRETACRSKRQTHPAPRRILGGHKDEFKGCFFWSPTGGKLCDQGAVKQQLLGYYAHRAVCVRYDKVWWKRLLWQKLQ